MGNADPLNTSQNIGLWNEKQFISRNRIKQLQDKIPDIRTIRHIDEKATNGIREEVLEHEFPGM